MAIFIKLFFFVLTIIFIFAELKFLKFSRQRIQCFFWLGRVVDRRQNKFIKNYIIANQGVNMKFI